MLRYVLSLKLRLRYMLGRRYILSRRNMLSGGKRSTVLSRESHVLRGWCHVCNSLLPLLRVYLTGFTNLISVVDKYDGSCQRRGMSYFSRDTYTSSCIDLFLSLVNNFW